MQRSVIQWLHYPLRALLATCLLTACSRQPDVITLSGATQGTTYHLSYWSPPQGNSATPEQLQASVTQALAQIDLQLSNYRQDSIIERFNASNTTTPFAVAPPLTELVTAARAVSLATAGCYDLTIKPVFDLWGFKAEVFHEPSAEALAAQLARVGMAKLLVDDAEHLRKTQPDLQVDFGSIGQGYSVGRLASLFEAAGIHNYLVEIGGEMQIAGAKPDGNPWRIALDKPLTDSHRWQKVLRVKPPAPLAIMTSGTYRHYFEHNGKRYSHILDGRTGRPITHHTVSVTVLHNNATLADAWSTALLCLGREAALALANSQGLAVLFVEQTPSGLVEFPSKTFGTLAGVAVADPD